MAEAGDVLARQAIQVACRHGEAADGRQAQQQTRRWAAWRAAEFLAAEGAGVGDRRY